MTKRATLVFLIAAALFVGGCKGGPKIVAPTPIPNPIPTPVPTPEPTPNPTPEPEDKSLCKKVPCTAIAKGEDGTEYPAMRVTFKSVTPEPGSIVPVPQVNCVSEKCFQAHLGMEWDGVNGNQNIRMEYEVYFGDEGKKPIGRSLRMGSTLTPGLDEILGSMALQSLPRYLLVKVWYLPDGQDNPTLGWAALELYK